MNQERLYWYMTSIMCILLTMKNRSAAKLAIAV